MISLLVYGSHRHADSFHSDRHFHLGLLFTWPACVAWAAIAANSYNKKVLAA